MSTTKVICIKTCVILFVVLLVMHKQIKPSSQDQFLIDFQINVNDVIETSKLSQEQQMSANRNIDSWLERCMPDNALPMVKWSTQLDIIEIVKVASRSPLVCDKGVPVAEDPAVYGQKTILSLPFDGVWHVVQGNNGIVSHLKGTKGEFAWDFVVHHKARQAEGDARLNENHYCWGKPILAPAPGVIVKTLDSLNDHDPYMPNPPQVGNHVYIDHKNGEISLVYHLMKDSVSVSIGQEVVRGQSIGLCGDTGISMFPHLHFQLFRGSIGETVKISSRFSGYYSWIGAEPVVDGDQKRKLKLSGNPKRLEYVINSEYYLNAERRE